MLTRSTVSFSTRNRLFLFVSFIAFSSLVFAISPMIKRYTIKPVLDYAVNNKLALYAQLNLANKGLSEKAFLYAVEGYEKLKRAGKLPDSRYLTVIDFSLSSAKKRMFIVDMEGGKLLFQCLVAHGKNSGKAYAQSFSNESESLQSSLGFYKTGGTYQGSNGLSLVLHGLEKGINDNAESRSVVLHGADYVSGTIAQHQGFIGRSFGCPAVPRELAAPIIKTINGGHCLFIYAPNKKYVKASKII
ncbi:MAG: murein L,D-transpeptidase catalytic domain family protein [Ferruginibacter sp.]